MSDLNIVPYSPGEMARMLAEADGSQECEIFGFAGILVQFVLAVMCVLSLTIKKFSPTETRSWKVFCFDINKQFITAGFAHALNLLLAEYLKAVTNSGNGCVWYFVTLLLDCSLSAATAFLIFKIIDETAIRLGIEILKSGVYIDKNVPLDDDEIDPDEYVDVRIWLVQVLVWIICNFISKIVVFFVQLRYHVELVTFGTQALAGFEGYPNTELITVMIIFPFVLNTIIFWVQDNFLSGSNKLDARKQEQIELRKKLARERRELKFNFGNENKNVALAAGELTEESQDSDGNIVIRKKMSINRQIEEGVYGVIDPHQQSIAASPLKH